MLICARYPNKINRLGIDSRALRAVVVIVVALQVYVFFAPLSFFFINPCTRARITYHLHLFATDWFSFSHFRFSVYAIFS